ncbi:hypothetical protein CDAR_528183 [Caerostris darwini]|uniref:Uncharacterized protein n=1 Tax=Caerostris darwini TaxID=1538125 RepID=A0AAV4SY75_9ARAC|nr:hypothetical protein CDAR_528183 [Caerostris darwini]
MMMMMNEVPYIREHLVLLDCRQYNLNIQGEGRVLILEMEALKHFAHISRSNTIKAKVLKRAMYTFANFASFVLKTEGEVEELVRRNKTINRNWRKSGRQLKIEKIKNYLEV